MELLRYKRMGLAKTKLPPPLLHRQPSILFREFNFPRFLEANNQDRRRKYLARVVITIDLIFFVRVTIKNKRKNMRMKFQVSSRLYIFLFILLKSFSNYSLRRVWNYYMEKYLWRIWQVRHLGIGENRDWNRRYDIQSYRPFYTKKNSIPDARRIKIQDGHGGRPSQGR